MQHLIIVYSNPETWEHPTFEHTSEFLASSAAEREEMSHQFGALMGEISGSGELVGGGAFAAPGQSRTVRVRDGVRSVADGTYLESREGRPGTSSSSATSNAPPRSQHGSSTPGSPPSRCVRSWADRRHRLSGMRVATDH